MRGRAGSVAGISSSLVTAIVSSLLGLLVGVGAMGACAYRLDAWAPHVQPQERTLLFTAARLG